MSITIKDVAKIANVSVSTVSRVLNEESNVKLQTVQKVKDAMKQCNYVPNNLARGLKSNSSHTIGFLVSDISNSHFTVMAKRIETLLRKNDFNMIICSTDENKEQELSYINHLMSSQIDGIILNTTGYNNSKIVKISQTLPTVLIERKISHPEFRGDYISSNNRDGIYQMAKKLLTLGHRKIGFINCEANISTGVERYEGFKNALNEAGIDISDNYPYLFTSDSFSIENGFSGCSFLMQMQNRPTAIIAANNTLAIGMLRYLRLANIKIPEDVSVLSYGNIDNSDLFFVNSGHTTLNPVMIGEKAAECILSRIAAPNQNNREIIFEPTLLTNSSVMPL